MLDHMQEALKNMSTFERDQNGDCIRIAMFWKLGCSVTYHHEKRSRSDLDWVCRQTGLQIET